MELWEKQISSQEIFDGRVIHVVFDRVALPDGGESTREVAYHPDGVAVLAVTDEEEILLVRQYRYPIRRAILEIPAGKMEKDETDPLACGMRELTEETGAAAASFVPFGSALVSPGFCDETIHLYKAEGLTFGDQHLDEDEFLNVEKAPFEKAYEMVMSGEINDGKTVIAILRYALERKNGGRASV